MPDIESVKKILLTSKTTITQKVEKGTMTFSIWFDLECICWNIIGIFIRD